MSGSIGQATAGKREKHQQSVEALDNRFVPYKLRFLLSLPEHESMLTNESMTQGIKLGIRQARVLVKLINNNTHSLEAVNNHIKASGQKLLK